LPVPKQEGTKSQIVFARVFIEGHYSLLETVKSNEKEMIFWEKDSTAFFLNNENDFLQFRGKVFLTQQLALVQMIRTKKFGESNMTFGDLSKIINKMNAIFYPKEMIKTRVNSTKLGFYVQGGVSSSNLLYQTPTTIQVAYENNYGYIGPKVSTNFGAFVQLNPTKKLTFELGVWYLKYENQKVMNIPGYTFVDTLHFALESFSIPFNIRYNFKLKGESAFFLKAGPQFNLNSKLDSWIIPNYSRERRNNLIKPNKNGYGFNLGLGYSKNINNLSLALEYRYSYTQLVDDVTNLGKQFTNGIYLNVGFIQK
jgi:opacity protein-like surface antigen